MDGLAAEQFETLTRNLLLRWSQAHQFILLLSSPTARRAGNLQKVASLVPGRGRSRTVHRRQKLSQGHQGGVPAAQGPARGRRDRRRHQRDALGADRHPGQGVPAAGGFALCRFVVFLLLFVLNLQTHLICTVPPYISQDICEPVVVQIFIVSAGKRSETHNFTFTPKGHHTALSASTTTTGSFFGLGGGDEIGPSGPAASVGGGNTGPASFNSLNSSFSSNQSEGKHLNCGLTE